jgi:hypothetical protein
MTHMTDVKKDITDMVWARLNAQQPKKGKKRDRASVDIMCGILMGLNAALKVSENQELKELNTSMQLLATMVSIRGSEYLNDLTMIKL